MRHCAPTAPFFHHFAGSPMDYDVGRCTRHCYETEHEFQPGEAFYSVLVADGAAIERRDYSLDAWKGEPDGAIGWWKSRMPGLDAKRKRWAPNDVMLDFFDELVDDPARQDMLYVLSLLLVRRRIFRHEDIEVDADGEESMVVYCPRRDETYRIAATMPDPSRIEEIQEELAQLLE